MSGTPASQQSHTHASSKDANAEGKAKTSLMKRLFGKQTKGMSAIPPSRSTADPPLHLSGSKEKKQKPERVDDSAGTSESARMVQLAAQLNESRGSEHPTLH